MVQCGTPYNPIPLGSGGGKYTPWNTLIPFGNAQAGNDSAADADVRAFLYLSGQAFSETKTQDYSKNRARFSLDALAQTGISTGLVAGPTAGSYILAEIYAEV